MDHATHEPFSTSLPRKFESPWLHCSWFHRPKDHKTPMSLRTGWLMISVAGGATPTDWKTSWPLFLLVRWTDSVGRVTAYALSYELIAWKAMANPYRPATHPGNDYTSSCSFCCATQSGPTRVMAKEMTCMLAKRWRSRTSDMTKRSFQNLQILRNEEPQCWLSEKFGPAMYEMGYHVVPDYP